MLHERTILIFPAGNTLSHVAQALAIAERLEAAGQECHLAAAAERVAWAAQFHPRCHVIPELWEPSNLPFPCLRWFSNRDHVERCLAAQEELIRRLKPGLVIGIFDFLSRASARGIPLLAINGACMLPCFEGVLGFAEADTPLRRRQQETLDRFWEFAARSLAPALQQRRLPAPARANELLLGDHNVIYELPELCGVSRLPAEFHAVGPIFWPGWEQVGAPPPWSRSATETTVHVCAGSMAIHAGAVERLIATAEDMGVRVLASTGQNGFSHTNGRSFCRPMLAPILAAGVADVAVCTGGIGVCYQNLACGTPSLVVPLQPEQATNGIHFQQQGCGRALAPEVVFVGHARQYADAINYEQFAAVLREMIEQRARFAAPLEKLRQRLQTCDALGDIARLAASLV
jgi:UDP:flavonoid glycosyltransferase YjiC (YdhE family)